MKRFLYILSIITSVLSLSSLVHAQTITAGAVTGKISACVGTPSAAPLIQQFTVSGSGLSADITATAPTGFEVSLAAGSGYGSSVTLAQTGGLVNNAIVYVRSSASATAGNITSNVTLTSPGATSQAVAVTGTVNALQTVNTVINQTLANGALTTAVNFTGTADGYSWVNNTPGIGLAASGTGNIAAFTAVNTGASAITATITVTPVSAGFAYIGNQVSNTVSVINTATNEVASIINVELAPSGAAVSPDGTRVYITDAGSNDVSVINTLTNAVIATIPVGTSPYGISESPDGIRVYVANINSNNISVINTTTNAVIAIIPVGMVPIGVSVSPDGSRVYVTNEGSNTVSVINTLTNSVISTIPVGMGPLGISVSPDGSKVYVTITGPGNLSVINTTTNFVISTIMVGSKPDAVSVSPDGLLVYVANQYSNTVSIINTTNNTVKTVNVGSLPTGLSVSPDGYWVYVSNSGSNTLSVINTATNTVNAAIPVGTLPTAFGNFVKGGTNCIGPPITFTITVNPTVPAVIVAGAATGSISACAGTVSASTNIQQFTVSGSDLTADIVATAPNNFEISLTAESGFGNTVTLPQSAGVVSSTIIYVRSAASAPAGSISGNVTLVSGTANQKVPVTGTINAPPVVNPVSNQTFVNGTTTTAINFTGTGDSYTWTNDNPAIGLPATGTGDIPSFTEVNNSAGPVIATITVTPNSATACSGTPVTFTITVNPTFTTTGTPAPLTTVYGTPSASTTFTVSVSNLTAGVLVTPPTGFEVSTDGINYSATITVAGVGTIGPLYPSGTVYIRLTSSTPVGDNYSGNIVLTSAGATNANVEMPVSTVTPAPLTITSDDKSKALGEANPVLTVTYSGFVNNDGPAQLTTQPAITTTALTESPAGQYPITAAGATDPNYTITYVPGVLTVNPQPEMISVPNAFTPNGDGINDTWVIKNLNTTYPNCTVAIFNRWGQRVYSSIGYPIPWNGTYRGAALPMGTYYYIINLKNGLKAFSGPVTIIR